MNVSTKAIFHKTAIIQACSHPLCCLTKCISASEKSGQLSDNASGIEVGDRVPRRHVHSIQDQDVLMQREVGERRNWLNQTGTSSSIPEVEYVRLVPGIKSCGSPGQRQKQKGANHGLVGTLSFDTALALRAEACVRTQNSSEVAQSSHFCVMPSSWALCCHMAGLAVLQQSTQTSSWLF